MEHCIASSEILNVVLNQPSNIRILLSTDDFIVLRNMLTNINTTWIWDGIINKYCQYPGFNHKLY